MLLIDECAIKAPFDVECFEEQQDVDLFALRWGQCRDICVAKIVVETAVLIQHASFYVDWVTCNSVTWNRSIWHLFRIGNKTFAPSTCKRAQK